MRSLTMRVASWVIPGALLGYAGCRWLDGLDGSHGPGLWWNVGHVGFLMSWLAFAALTVAMARGLRSGVWWPVAAGALVGIAAFMWVNVTDVFPRLADLPDPLRAAGPLLFLAGFGALLGVIARRNGYRGWVWFPVLALAAVLAVAVNLAFLPVTAVLFIPALAPCRSRGAMVGAR